MTIPWNVYDLLMYRLPLEADERGCIVWPRAKTVGYGRIKVNGKLDMAHRVTYEMMYGPIPEGLHIDHLCRNRACVNPLHLEAVTPWENTLRGVGNPFAIAAKKQRCGRGHEFDYTNANGQRICRTCKRIRKAQYKAARKAVAA